MNYLAAKFSLKMLPGDMETTLIRVESITPKDIPLDVQNYIGYPSMRNVVEGIIGRKIGTPRKGAIKLKKGDTLYVASHKGVHLPTGTKELPAGASISFSKINWKAL